MNGDGQQKAARRFKVSQSAVSKWESRETGMDRKHLPELREYAVAACRRLLRQVGARIDVPAEYDCDDAELSHLESEDPED